jgi:hypothetical protein
MEDSQTELFHQLTIRYEIVASQLSPDFGVVTGYATQRTAPRFYPTNTDLSSQPDPATIPDGVLGDRAFLSYAPDGLLDP